MSNQLFVEDFKQINILSGELVWRTWHRVIEQLGLVTRGSEKASQLLR